MKTTKSKKLNRSISTICDFNDVYPKNFSGETDPPTGTDPTNTTITIITTVNTHFGNQKLTA
ncbi:hypothetical protein PQ469_03160 [Mucilaginibacter sp. KACC 22773]|uniref:hypothetical protein n=1 Tax=Mucilaginibacter sp. KACC 22773 TaxID=3025671 RepID=UPI00236591DB|nr:hypothetical protein [Mucilaginibacter sp. KACC 22773]WDF79004.1 hypothetical protein PQ469_03160 [Mucilaginibacter sp. KACC 22773]